MVCRKWIGRNQGTARPCGGVELSLGAIQIDVGLIELRLDEIAPLAYVVDLLREPGHGYDRVC